MKIAYFSNGETIHDQRFFDRFEGSGCELHIISFQSGLLEARRRNMLPELRGAHLYNLPLDRFADVSFFDKLLNTVKGVFYSRRVVRNIRPDIVMACHIIDKYGFIAALTKARPLVLLPGGTDVQITSKTSRLRRFFIKYAVRRSGVILADAEIIKKELLDLVPGYPGDKIKVTLLPGVDLDKFNPSVPKVEITKELGWENKKILIMTRSMIDRVYGIECFLEALVHVTREFPDVRVIFCGDGPYRQSHMEFLKRNKINEYAYFAGHVENGSLAAFLNAADIYVSSSLSDGTPLSLLEAMACRLPVVVTDVPAVMEWVKDGYNGYLVPRKDPEALAGKIIALLRNDGLREAMAKENHRIARERIDIERNFEKLMQTLCETLNEHRKERGI